MAGLIEKHPHHSLLFRCGAVVVARKIAVTAAHCVKAIPVHFILLKFPVSSSLCFRKSRFKAASPLSEETQPNGRTAILLTTRFAQQHFIRNSIHSILTTILGFSAWLSHFMVNMKRQLLLLQKTTT